MKILDNSIKNQAKYPLQSITILLCLLIRNTWSFKTYYFAKYYYNTFSTHKFQISPYYI